MTADASISSSSQTTPAGVFGTRIPSSVCFAIGLLLFLLPFAELRCKPPIDKATSFMNMIDIKITAVNTGWGLALGSDWKFSSESPNNNPLVEQNKSVPLGNDIKEQDPNAYAIIALCLAVLGLGLSFINTRLMAAINILPGILSAGALIGLMADLTGKSKDLISRANKASDMFSISDKDMSLTFTPWFYVCVIVFLVAAFFSYKRMQLIRE